MTNLESIAEWDTKRAMQLNKPMFDLIEQIFAPASPDDKRVKAAKKCLKKPPLTEEEHNAFPKGRW
jgi:hypothetical protein